ncbi:hypothetical protein BGZ60DRAFT_412771 [Tricladium varicosporioides]|nr:hypothetical protein BGZ60DRAFT_412771 [Hymenoscyphus varicosporioides]
MRPSELAHFEHALYCVWTIGVMGMTPHLQEQASTFLNKYSPRGLSRLLELRTWARGYNYNDFGSLGLASVSRTLYVSIGMRNGCEGAHIYSKYTLNRSLIYFA